MTEEYRDPLHDELTRLPNRTLFLDRLDHALARARRNQSGNPWKAMAAVMLLDIDKFKLLNETWGTAIGDQLLQATAERARDCIRSSDTIARLEGDRFGLVLEELAGPEDATIVADKVLAAFEAPVAADEMTFKLTVSIGISIYPLDGNEAEALLKIAEKALHRAQETRNCYRLWSRWDMEDLAALGPAVNG